MDDLEEGEIEEIEDVVPAPVSVGYERRDSPLSSSGGGYRQNSNGASHSRGRSPLQDGLVQSPPTALQVAQRYAKFHRPRRRSPPDAMEVAELYAKHRQEDGVGSFTTSRDYNHRPPVSSKNYVSNSSRQPKNLYESRHDRQSIRDDGILGAYPGSGVGGSATASAAAAAASASSGGRGGTDDFDNMLRQYRQIQDSIDLIDKYQQIQDELKTVGERKQLLMEESKRGPSGTNTPERRPFESPGSSPRIIAMHEPVEAPEPPPEIVLGSSSTEDEVVYDPTPGSHSISGSNAISGQPSTSSSYEVKGQRASSSKVTASKAVTDLFNNAIQVLEAADEIADGAVGDEGDEEEEEEEEDEETVEELQLRMMALQSAARRNPESMASPTGEVEEGEEDEEEEGEVVENGEEVGDGKEAEVGDRKEEEEDSDVIEVKDYDDDDDVIIEEVRYNEEASSRDFRDVDMRRNRWKDIRGGGRETGRYQDPVYLKSDKTNFASPSPFASASNRGGSVGRERSKLSPTPSNIRQGLSDLRRRESQGQRPSTPRDNYERVSMEITSSDDENDPRNQNHNGRHHRFHFNSPSGAPQLPPMPEMFLPLRDGGALQSNYPPKLNASPRPPPPLPTKPLSPPPPPPRETPPRLMDVTIPRLAPSPPAAPDLNFRPYMPPRQAPPPPSFSMSLPGVAEIPLPPLLAPSPPKMPSAPRGFVPAMSDYERSPARSIADSSVPVVAPSPPHDVIEYEASRSQNEEEEDDSSMSDISEDDPWELLEKSEMRGKGSNTNNAVELHVEDVSRSDLEGEKDNEIVGSTPSVDNSEIPSEVNENQNDDQNVNQNEDERPTVSDDVNKTMRVRRVSKRKSLSQQGEIVDEEEEEEEEGEEREEDEDDLALRAQLLAAMAKKKDSPVVSGREGSVSSSPARPDIINDAVVRSSETNSVTNDVQPTLSGVVETKAPNRNRKRKVSKKKRIAQRIAQNKAAKKAKSGEKSGTSSPARNVPTVEGTKTPPLVPSTAASVAPKPSTSASNPTQQPRRVPPKAPKFLRPAPVIINIGNDSSDEENESGENDAATSSQSTADPLSNNIDSFLKEMRGQAAKKEQNIVNMLQPEKAMEYLKLKEELSRRAATSAKVALKSSENFSANESGNASPASAGIDQQLQQPEHLQHPELLQEQQQPQRSAADEEKIRTLENMYKSNRKNIQVLSTDIFKQKTNMDRKILNLSRNEEKIKKMKEQIKAMEQSSEKMNDEIISLKDRMTADHERLQKQRSLEESIKKKMRILNVDPDVQRGGGGVNAKRKATTENSDGSNVSSKRIKSVEDIETMNSSQVLQERSRLLEVERQMAAKIAQHQKEMAIRRSYSFMQNKPDGNEKMGERDDKSAADANTEKRKRRSLMELESNGIKPKIKEDDANNDDSTAAAAASVEESPIIELPSDEKLAQLRQIQLEREKKPPSVMKDALLMSASVPFSHSENQSNYDSIIDSLNFEMIFPADAAKAPGDIPPFLLGSEASVRDQSADSPPTEDGAPQSALGDKGETGGIDDQTKPYETPLLSLKSLRLLPKFRLKYNLKLSSPSFSNKFPLNASVFCHFDLTGSCNDDSCRSLHHSDVPLLSNQLVVDLAAYAADHLVAKNPDSVAKLTDSEAALLLGNYSKEFMLKNSYKDVSSEDLSILISSNVNEVLMKNNVKPSEMLVRSRSFPWKPIWQVDRKISSAETQPEEENEDAVWKRWKMPRKEKDYDEAINLQNPMGGDNCYGEGLVLPGMQEDLEAAVMENPDHVHLWMNLASLRMRTGEGVDECYESCLNVLARGLEVNQSSTQLWLRYLCLFHKYKTHKGDFDAREFIVMLKQAVASAPTFKLYHWMFALETTFDGKIEGLNAGLKHLIASASRSESSPDVSHKVFTLIVNRIALLHSCQLLARIAKTFDLILNGQANKTEGIIEDERELLTPLKSILSVDDLAALHLVFVYTSVMKGQLPQCIFDPAQGSYGAVVKKNSLYLIPFEVASIPNLRYWTNIGSKLLAAIQSVTTAFESLLTADPESNFSHPAVSLILNYVHWASFLPKSGPNQLNLVSIHSLVKDKCQSSEKKALAHVGANLERLSIFVSSSPSLRADIQSWKIIFDAKSTLTRLTADSVTQRECFESERTRCLSEWPREPFPHHDIASKSNSRSFIEDYVGSQFSLSEAQSELLKDDRRESVIQIFFEKILGLLPSDDDGNDDGDLNSLSHQLPPPDPEFLTFLAEKPQRRVFIWLCYIKWLQLSSASSSSSSSSSSNKVAEAFELALSLCPTSFEDGFDDVFMLGRTPRQVLWFNYLNYLSQTFVATSSAAASSSSSVSVSRFVATFKKCLSTTPLTKAGDGHVMIASPDVKFKSGDGKDKWEDFTFHNQVIDLFLRHCDDRVWPLLLFRLVQTYPTDAYLLLRLASFFFSKSFVEEAASLKAETMSTLVVDAVKRVPHLVCLWRILISRLLKEGKVDAARTRLRNCLEMNPTHSTMWKDWFLFELGHLKSRDEEEKVREISNFANKSLSTCNLDLRAYLKDMCGKEKKTSAEGQN